MTRFGLSLATVRARTMESNATDEPHEIEFHEGIVFERQFDAKGVFGPVSAAYCVATDICDGLRQG